MVYEVNVKKKQYIEKWTDSRPEYQSKRRLVTFLYTVSVSLFALHVVIPIVLFRLGNCNAAAIGAGVGIGLVAAVIPFAFARPISVKMKREYGSPYTKREEERLTIYEDGIEFAFHNADSRYRRSMDVYRIPIENINAVRYDADYHIITIIGQGELLSYDDYPTKRLNYQNSQRRFYSNSPYSILTAFDPEEEVISRLCNMAKNKNEDFNLH